MPLDPGTRALLDFVEQAGRPPIHEGSPETARKAVRAMSCDLVTPEQVVPVHAVEERDVAGRRARAYRPAAGGERPTVLYLHGGGYVVGDLDRHDQTCRRLANDADAVVVSVDYRLAPEHPFPAACEDAVAAGSWVADHLAGLGGSRVLGIAGDSAGGNLAAVAAQATPDRFAAQLLVYPAVDMVDDYPSRHENADGYLLEAATMGFFTRHYLPGDDRVDLADPRLSPLRGSLEGQPPAVVVTAEYDPLRDEGEAYAEALRAAGTSVDAVRYDGLIHGFADMVAASPAAAAAVADMHARFRALLHAG
jgi:acetyl esterase